MIRSKTLAALLLVFAILAAAYGFALIRHGFSANAEPSSLERVVARTVRNISIPSRAREAKNPWKPTLTILNEARDNFANRCANCHGNDGSGQTQVGRNLYPKAPDLRSPQTQSLTDGEIHYIIKNGVRLTGMPAWSNPHDEQDDTELEASPLRPQLPPTNAAGSSRSNSRPRNLRATTSAPPPAKNATQQIYEHWKKTPMANVVRDPREHPDAIIPDLATNTDPLSSSRKTTSPSSTAASGSSATSQKVGDDYFPEPAQWDVTHKVWRPYFVAKGTDWWATALSPRQHEAPHRPDLRRLPFRQLQHPHQASHRVERRLRALPRPRQRARRTTPRAATS